jgi:hypothetical protein
VIGTSGSGGGGFGAALADVGKVLDATPDPKTAPKRAATATRSGGSGPPPKRFRYS